MTRQAVVMAGPLPPAVGGMASVLGALQASTLPRRVDLALFETGKTTPPGRPLWRGVAARVGLMADWWRQLGRRPRPLAHIHTCSGLTFFLDGALLLLCRLRGVPVVLHVHGGYFDAFLDRLPKPLALLAGWLARRAAVVIVLSPDWRDRLAKRWPQARLAVVANGVAAGQVARAVDAPGVPAFAFLGGLSRAKGLEVLLQAATLARAPWRVDLAGAEAEPGFERWLRGQVASRGLEGRIRLLGPVVGAAKDALLAGAQGFVLPSLAEGLPMALLESMAIGLPPVATAVGAIPEVVREGVEGRLVPAGDAVALAGALDALAGDPSARRRLGEAAAARCRSLYGIERMVEALLAVYDEVQGRRA